MHLLRVWIAVLFIPWNLLSATLDRSVDFVWKLVVPYDSRQTSSYHQDRKVPERIVQHSRRPTEENQDPRELVRDGLCGKLDSGESNDADSRTVQAR